MLPKEVKILFVVLCTHSGLDMTVGDFVLVNTYLFQLYSPLGFLGSAYSMIKNSLVDLENIFQLRDEEIEVKDGNLTLLE